MKKVYWLDAQRRKNDEGSLAYSTQSGFSALYLQRNQKNICPVQAQHSADQWDGYQTLPKKNKEAAQKKLFSLPVNYLVLQKLLKSAPQRSDGSLGFFSEYGHSMSIYRDPGGWLTIFSAEFDPSYGEEGGDNCFEGTLDDPIDLFEKAKEAACNSSLRQSDSEWDQMIRELIYRLFDLPDYRKLPTFVLTIPRGEKRIGDRTFYCASSVSSTVVPHGVTHIGKMAFAGCTNLSKLTLPDTLRTMGSCAFAYCRSLKSVIIPEGIEIIPANAFKRCSSLRSVTLPRSLKHISDGAFEGCTSLEQITLPDGLRSIGRNVFASCTQLRSIAIPPQINTIESNTFFACRSLESVCLHDGIRFIGSFAFSGSSLGRMIIPDGVRTIADSTFQNCSKLESITLPDSIESINERAFCGTALKELHLPHGTASIGEEAFSHCPNLREVVLPDIVQHIAHGLFKSCPTLYLVTLPPTLPFIPDNTFENCSSLIHIIAPIDKIPSCNQEAACIGFARDESLYPQALHSEYLSFIRTHIDALWGTALEEPSLLRLLCREKMIGKTHFPLLLDESICRNEIELTSLLLDYKKNHPDIMSDAFDDNLSLE